MERSWRSSPELPHLRKFHLRRINRFDCWGPYTCLDEAKWKDVESVFGDLWNHECSFLVISGSINHPKKKVCLRNQKLTLFKRSVDLYYFGLFSMITLSLIQIYSSWILHISEWTILLYRIYISTSSRLTKKSIKHAHILFWEFDKCSYKCQNLCGPKRHKLIS